MRYKYFFRPKSSIRQFVLLATCVFVYYAVIFFQPSMFEFDKRIELNGRYKKGVFLHTDLPLCLAAMGRYYENIREGKMIFSRNAFYPEKNMRVKLKYGDMAPLPLLLGCVLKRIIAAPLFSIYNMLAILAMICSAWAMYLYVSTFFENRLVAFLSGFFYATSPYLMREITYGHPNMFFICWIPLIFYFVTALLFSPSYKNALFLTLACIAQMFSSAKYSLLLTIVIPLYCLLLFIFERKKIFSLKKSLFFLCISGIIVIVSAGLYLSLFGSVSSKVVTHEDAFTSDIIRFFYRFFQNRLLSVLVIMITAGYACVQKKHLISLVFVSIAIICAYLAIGKTSWLYSFLYSYWPFFDCLRMPYIFKIFTTFSLSIIYALFFYLVIKGVIAGLQRYIPTLKERPLSSVCWVMIFGIIVCWHLPRIKHERTMPIKKNFEYFYHIDKRPEHALYTWIGNQKDNGVVLEYPQDLYLPMYFYNMLIHEKRTIGANLPFGTLPPSYYRILSRLGGRHALNIQNDGWYHTAKELNIKYIVFHKKYFEDTYLTMLKNTNHLTVVMDVGTAVLFLVK